jgi:cold shock CspA family protein
MRLSGTLRSWNDERGFGFIAPTHGGAELFVHVSALPRDGSRPTMGEKLTYEPGRGRDGQPCAVGVRRDALGGPARPASARRSSAKHGRPFLPQFVVVVLLLALAAFGFERYQRRATAAPSLAKIVAPVARPAVAPAAGPSGFRCDGRTHCSQMTSCAEATFFLRNCPDTQMDGNHDGVPCEQQWCRR